MRLKTPTGNPALDRELRAMDKAIDDLDVEVVEGRLIENVSLPDGVVTIVNTGLGRKWRGWAVVDLHGPAAVGCIQRVVPALSAAQPSDNQLWLQASGYAATIVVSLWVF